MSWARRRPLSILVALLILVLAVVLLAVFIYRDQQRDNNEIPTRTSQPGQPARAAPAASAEPGEAGIRSALIELCSGNNPVTTDLEERIGPYDEFRDRLLVRLSASTSAEHQLVAALIAEDAELKFNLLRRAIAADGDNAFVLWSAVQMCSELPDARTCPLPEWEQRLITLDGQNSESWIRIAANRYATDKVDMALEALRYATAAAESRSYWPEMIETIERALAAGSNHDFPERAELAFGIAAAMPPNYGDYVTMCKEASANDAEWAYTCIAYGELVENQGRTELGVAIGRAIQKIALEALGLTEEAAEVTRRMEVAREVRREAFGVNSLDMWNLIYADPVLFHTYIEAVKTHGEIKAAGDIADEVKRLMAQQPELHCHPN